MRPYDIKDITLAPSGHQKIRWVKYNMPLLFQIEEEFKRTKPFEGVKISISIHMEAKTAYLCLVLAAGGADIAATGSNVLSTEVPQSSKAVSHGKILPQNTDISCHFHLFV